MYSGGIGTLSETIGKSFNNLERPQQIVVIGQSLILLLLW